MGSSWGQSSLFAQAREQGLWLAVKPSEVRVEPRRCISLKIHQSHLTPNSEKNLIRNRANGMSEIEGKVTRVGANECGQRASFKPGIPEAQDAADVL